MSDPATPPPADGTHNLQPSDQERIARDLGPSTSALTPSGSASVRPAAQPQIGRFEIRRMLGEGAFGRVYLAFDPSLDREVAVKVPHSVGLTTEFRERFLREARATAKIHHPNVCPVYEAGVEGDLPYIVMRFVPGGCLADLLKRGPLTLLDALEYTRKLALGLEAAHARGVIHRDLKPANVLYDDAEREMLVADFGLARLADQSGASSGGIKGTPKYMAPEQWGDGERAGAVGPLSDVYSLGVILYELLTGELPFKGNAFALMVAHTRTAPRPPSAVRPSLNRGFDDLCMKALAKIPAERYLSAKEFASALADHLRTGGRAKTPTRVRSPVANRPKPAPVSKKPAAVLAAPVVQMVNLTVSGRWLSQPAGNPYAVWQKVADTPAEITIEPEKVYRLQINRSVTNRELQGVEAVKGLTALRRLILAHCDKISDVGLTHLKEFTALQQLDLTWCKQLTDAGLVHLKGLTALQQLDLWWCVKLTDTGLDHLKGLTALRRLILKQCDKITDAGLAHLKGLTALQILDLSACDELTDAGLAHLKGLTALRELRLGWCSGLTDGSLVYLKRLTALQYLDLVGCDQIKAAGVAALQETLPNCRIRR